ncbi:hypothetical protein [Planotetraspora kaengkrachanensis]|uniref:ABC transporter permease n=1 Tax=Planotetraspora kaengkrachanensis TaxID=575193 RepID=A0A8J3LTN8_9ACTN|nr:hypothetical protein [Planotetraspora kaengkrachanensis]GIG78582.1 hypothetical protein Pka01_17090 [Planotetraspora kaengkrachanensis]
MKQRVLVSAALVTLLSLTAACGGSGREEQQQPAAEAGAVTVTMWTRAATWAQSGRPAEAYNWPLITVGLFAFLAAWNDFFAPLILLNDGASFALTVAVVSMTQNTAGTIVYGMLQAGVMVMAVPCLILLLVVQRRFVRGYMSGALRG